MCVKCGIRCRCWRAACLPGAAVYVSLVEHPARMECGVEIATAEFPPSYHRGTIMQVTLAAVCLLSSIAAWLAGATFWWVVAGALQVSVIPLVLKKSPSWCLRGRQQQGYKQTRVSDAAGNRHSRRLAAYDGATRPFGVAVLLLPHRRSGSSKPLVTFHRPLRQLRFCA